ncbi:MAG: trehalose-6-phosphate synthase, partial [Candidatus Omnitrophota bacterium]
MWTRQDVRKIVQEKIGKDLLIVVSNREPYIHRFEGEEIVCQSALSGLTVSLDPVMQACGGTWIAHASGEADRKAVDAHDRVRVPPENPSYALRRVWLTKEEEDGYYYGFSNTALWPLCHITYTRPTFNECDWDTYRAVNKKFAEVVLDEVKNRNAFVFIQDYHFTLLARHLQKPNIYKALFWHIPWPNPEAFRICPWGEEILDGMLGNDLLGFHIQHHCQNFLSTVDRMLEAKVDHERSEITREKHTTRVHPFPISVDFDAITEHASSKEVVQEMEEIRRRYGLRDKIIGLGVDRVDYTKGIPEQFQALDRFLERYPKYQGKLTIVEIGVPSRTHLPMYQRVNDEIDQLVESINWKYQRDNWKPILYLKELAPSTALRAWYRLADFCIINSLHDGMNLVAKEFVSSRCDEDGVL